MKHSHYPSSWRPTITSSVLQLVQEQRKRDLICYFPSFPSSPCLHFPSVCSLSKLSSLLQMVSLTANGFILPTLPLRQCSGIPQNSPQTVTLLLRVPSFHFFFLQAQLYYGCKQTLDFKWCNHIIDRDRGPVQHIFIQRPFKSPPAAHVSSQKALTHAGLPGTVSKHINLTTLEG